LQDVILHAESAAIDLRGAQLDQLKQLLVNADLCSGTTKRCDGIVSIGRQQLEVVVLASGM
jgi:hypothetical protein